ncbi:transglycosylase family protein [Tomitella biformata]|uniref:transglycosylase family protein n=1 Tax=Tomitella biformata TaxID=630403 RepID=UPI000466A043|nr:transglycosylase family protein [Tomitella biformata]
MTGRHRTPSTAGRNITKIAVSSAVIGAASIAFAGTANAATDAEWDKVAQCESTGNWAINTGNGYHGGLQFSPSTWTSHGGGAYAATANQATKAQQIEIAEKVLANQGKGAWPSCGVGLSGATQRTPAPAPVAQAAPTVAQVQSFPGAVAADATTEAAILDTLISIADSNNIEVSPELRAAAEQAIARITASTELDKADSGVLDQYLTLASTLLS